MSGPLILFVTLIYIWISIEQGVKENVALSVVYGGYAVANFGLWWMAK